MTCGRTQEFLAHQNIETAELVDARKSTLKQKEALALATQVDEIYAMKGKKIVHFDMRKEKPNKETLLQSLLGPTGNLRAPTLRVGRTLLVGFDGETYRKVLG